MEQIWGSRGSAEGPWGGGGGQMSRQRINRSRGRCWAGTGEGGRFSSNRRGKLFNSNRKWTCQHQEDGQQKQQEVQKLKELSMTGGGGGGGQRGGGGAEEQEDERKTSQQQEEQERKRVERTPECPTYLQSPVPGPVAGAWPQRLPHAARRTATASYGTVPSSPPAQTQSCMVTPVTDRSLTDRRCHSPATGAQREQKMKRLAKNRGCVWNYTSNRGPI